MYHNWFSPYYQKSGSCFSFGYVDQNLVIIWVLEPTLVSSLLSNKNFVVMIGQFPFAYHLHGGSDGHHLIADWLADPIVPFQPGLPHMHVSQLVSFYPILGLFCPNVACIPNCFCWSFCSQGQHLMLLKISTLVNLPCGDFHLLIFSCFFSRWSLGICW